LDDDNNSGSVEPVMIRPHESNDLKLIKFIFNWSFERNIIFRISNVYV